MALQWNIILLFTGLLQAALFAFLLLRKRASRAGNIFLILYLLVMIAQLAFKIADKYWLMQNLKNSYFLSYQFPLLYGPLIYLFANNMLRKNIEWSLADYMHFLPFVYGMVLSNPDLSYPFMNWLYLPVKGTAGLCVQLASLSIYHFQAYKIWQQQSENKEQYFCDSNVVRIRWLRKFIVLSFIVTTIIALLIFILYQTYPGYANIRFGFLLLAVFVYWITYSAMNNPVMFAIMPGHKSAYKTSMTNAPVPTFFVHKPKKKYANSTLKEDEASRIIAHLQMLTREKKVFTDQTINIEQLSVLLNTSRHILSQVINEKMGLSFYDYINSYRIEEAKLLLKEPARQNYKIAFIAYEAGFNSLSTFNDVFKKMTGLTPSQYRESAVEENSKQRV